MKIKLTESELRNIIRESVEKILREGEFQNHYTPYSVNPSMRARGHKMKMSKNSYPATIGKMTDYGKVDVDNEYAPSRNKFAMKQHQDGNWDLNRSINHKDGAGLCKSHY